MKLTFSFSTATLGLSLICSVNAGTGENVVLANCVNRNGVQSSQMAYFSGSPNSQPVAIASVHTDVGRTVVWEGAEVTAEFPDGNTFISSIPRDPGDGQYAGTGRNKLSSFTCYKHWQPNLYFTGDGGSCSQVYYCNHNSPHDSTRIDFKISSDMVTLDGDFSAQNIFWNVWSRRDATWCNSESPVQITDLCSIKFTCHGDTPWKTTNALSSTLQDVVGKQPNIASKRTTTVCLEYDDRGPEEPLHQQQIHHGPPKCIKWGHHVTTSLPTMVRLEAVNIPFDGHAANSGGYMQYDLTCNAPSYIDCKVCKGLETGFKVAAVIPVIGAIFGIANFGITAACDSSHC